jgi:hypothetical protein
MGRKKKKKAPPKPPKIAPPIPVAQDIDAAAQEQYLQAQEGMRYGASASGSSEPAISSTALSDFGDYGGGLLSNAKPKKKKKSGNTLLDMSMTGDL